MNAWMPSSSISVFRRLAECEDAPDVVEEDEEILGREIGEPDDRAGKILQAAPRECILRQAGRERLVARHPAPAIFEKGVSSAE